MAAQRNAERIASRSKEIEVIAALLKNRSKKSKRRQTLRSYARAASDDRKAFDGLLAIRDQPTHTFYDLARSALFQIVGESSSKLTFSPDREKDRR